MSGKKCARVDLTAEAKRELERILDNNRQTAQTLANLSNLLGRLKSLQEDVAHYLDSPTISEGFRQKLKAFGALIAPFITQFDELRKQLDQLEQLRHSPDPVTARDQASRLQNEIKRLLQELEQLAAEITAQLQGVEQSIAAEGRVEEYQARQAARHALTGLLEEVKMRLHPATSLSLQSVAERANELLARLEELCLQPGQVYERDVQECRTQLGELSREAEAREWERQTQWEIFKRLNQAFQGAGFYLDTPVQMPPHDTPIKARHVIAEEELRASVDTLVHKGGDVIVDMSGESGDESVVLGKDQHCDVNLARLVDRALRCGLTFIKGFKIRDSNSPTGWTAMELPGIENLEDEETQLSSSVKHAQQKEAIPPK